MPIHDYWQEPDTLSYTQLLQYNHHDCKLYCDEKDRIILEIYKTEEEYIKNLFPRAIEKTNEVVQNCKDITDSYYLHWRVTAAVEMMRTIMNKMKKAKNKRPIIVQAKKSCIITIQQQAKISWRTLKDKYGDIFDFLYPGYREAEKKRQEEIARKLELQKKGGE